MSNAKTFWALLRTDLYLLSQMIRDKMLDLAIWVAGTLLVATYLLPSFGIQASYGVFAFAGACGTAGLFEVFPSVMQMVGDLDGDNVLSYYLTLPMLSHLVFMRAVVYYAITALLLGSMVTVLGGLLVYSRIDLAAICPTYLVIMLLVSAIFYGVLTLWLASFPAGMHKVGSIWMRFIYPMWILGGAQHSWDVLYNWNHYFGYAMLLNPMTYVMEGFRHAIMGKAGSISFPVCVGALLLCCTLGYLHAIMRWKRKLDFV